MSNGWIKLHRQLQESPFYTNSVAVHVWLECLLRAAHDERTVYMKRERITLMPGQFVMGREEFGRSIGVSPTTAWYWITQFESDSMIDIKKTTKGSLVTVKKWHDYQKFDSTSDNEKPADEQPMDTNKKEKKVKNARNKETYAVRPETETLYEAIDSLCRQYGLQNKVDKKALDVQVERHISKIRLGVEVKKCVTWLIDRGMKDVTTMRLANWFEKAKEIQKREQLRQMERKEAEINPAMAQRRERKKLKEGFDHERSVEDFVSSQA